MWYLSNIVPLWALSTIVVLYAYVRLGWFE